MHNDVYVTIKSFDKGLFVSLLPWTEIISWRESCFCPIYRSTLDFPQNRTYMNFCSGTCLLAHPFSWEKSILYSTRTIKDLMLHLTSNRAPGHQVHIREDNLGLRTVQCIFKAQPRKIFVKIYWKDTQSLYSRYSKIYSCKKSDQTTNTWISYYWFLTWELLPSCTFMIPLDCTEGNFQ